MGVALGPDVDAGRVHDDFHFGRHGCRTGLGNQGGSRTNHWAHYILNIHVRFTGIVSEHFESTCGVQAVAQSWKQKAAFPKVVLCTNICSNSNSSSNNSNSNTSSGSTSRGIRSRSRSSSKSQEGGGRQARKEGSRKQEKTTGVTSKTDTTAVPRWCRTGRTPRRKSFGAAVPRHKGRRDRSKLSQQLAKENQKYDA